MHAVETEIDFRITQEASVRACTAYMGTDKWHSLSETHHRQSSNRMMSSNLQVKNKMNNMIIKWNVYSREKRQSKGLISTS